MIPISEVDNKTPLLVLKSSDGTYEEVAYMGEDGEFEFAEASSPSGTTVGPGGIDPQDVAKLIGEKTGIVEATYGDVEVSEYEDDMRGRDGLVLYIKMLTDSSIEQGLSYRRDTMTNAKWRMVPAGSDPESLEQAAFCADQLGLGDMKAGKYSFHQLLSLASTGEILKRGIGELCFAPGPDGKIVLDKVIPIHPLTVDGIEYDNKGGIKNIVQKGKLRGENGKDVEKKIPIFKTVIFTNRDDGVGEGESILRAAIVHWRIKRALMVLMNQGLERFALGVPMIKPPAEVKPKSAQWLAARKMAIDYVTRPRTGVILPAGWEFEPIVMKNSMPEIIPYIEYHDRCIMRALGVEGTSVGLKEGQSAPVGAMQMTEASVKAMLIRFASAINLYVIPKLILLNWPNATRYPRLVPELDNADDISAAANLFGMIMNGAIDMTVSKQQTEAQMEMNSQKVSAQGKAGSVAGGGSRSGSGKSPSAKFSEELEFAENKMEAAPDETLDAVKNAMLGLVSVMPTKMKRLLGYLEDEQTAALDPYRMSAQTVRSVDNRKPTGTVKIKG